MTQVSIRLGSRVRETGMRGMHVAYLKPHDNIGSPKSTMTTDALGNKSKGKRGNTGNEIDRMRDGQLSTRKTSEDNAVRR